MTRGTQGSTERGEDSSERLFIALALPDALRAPLSDLVEAIPGARWTQPAQLHLTLRFLGDVPVDGIGRLEELLSGVRVQSFVLPIEGVGSFPPKGPPRTLWAGVGSGHPHLFQLRQRVDDALLSAGLECDLRSFQPHVTLARCTEASAGAAGTWQRRHASFCAASFRVAAFDLCRSRLLSEGAEHTLRRRFLLG